MTFDTLSPTLLVNRASSKPLASLTNAGAARVTWMFLGLALFLGGILRAYSLFTLPFAINDGGLFWAMTQEIADANFALPARVAYPTATPDIPFCYPPLGFYIAAVFFKLGVPLETIFRWLPWAWSMGTIWAFWRLARVFWQSDEQREWAVGAATLLWAILPWSFIWHVMGGGVTRAPGLFFSLLAMEAALSLWRDGRSKKWLPLVLFLALAVVTHLERARFGVVAVGLIWAFYGRTPRGAAQLCGALGGAVLLSAPWWGLCLARFGLEPFLAAAHSGSRGWQHGSFLESLGPTIVASLTGEAVLPLFHLLGGAGLLWCLWRRQWFLPIWFLLILLLDVRSGQILLTVPLALSAGGLLAHAARARVPFVTVTTLWLCALSIMVQQNQLGLSANDLAAMQWVKRNTPSDARFLLLESVHWSMDASGEWFPVLTGRTGVLTVQGAEWLSGDEFRRRYELHEKMGKRTQWHSIAKLAERENLRFDWVWSSEKVHSTEPGAGWVKVWSQGKNAIWHRVALAKPLKPQMDSRQED